MIQAEKLLFVTAFTIFLLLGSFASVSSNQVREKTNKKRVPIHIESEKMKSDNSKNMVSFFGNVVAIKGKMTIYSDEMDVYTDEDQKHLKKIIATGKVKIVKEGMVATCLKAIYEEIEEKLTLIGDAVVVNKDDVIEGSKIIYFLDQENIVVLGDDKKRVKVILFPTDDMGKKYSKKGKKDKGNKESIEKSEEKELTIDRQ